MSYQDISFILPVAPLILLHLFVTWSQIHTGFVLKPTTFLFLKPFFEFILGYHLTKYLDIGPFKISK